MKKLPNITPNHLVERKTCRSDHMQHLFAEIAFAPEMLSIFSNDESISARLDPWQYDERLFDLYEKLRKEFWRVAKECLTERQYEIVELTAQGMTQQQCASMLSINQSSIAKSLRGNVDYSEDGPKVEYGGSERKLREMCAKDKKIQRILKRIDEIRESKW